MMLPPNADSLRLEGTANVEVHPSLRDSAHALLDKASDWQERIRHRAEALGAGRTARGSP